MYGQELSASSETGSSWRNSVLCDLIVSAFKVPKGLVSFLAKVYVVLAL